MVSSKIFQGPTHQSADGQVLGASVFSRCKIRPGHTAMDMGGHIFEMGLGPFGAPVTLVVHIVHA